MNPNVVWAKGGRCPQNLTDGYMYLYLTKKENRMKRLVLLTIMIMLMVSLSALSMSDFKLADVDGSRKNPLHAKQGYIVADTYKSRVHIGFSGSIRGSLANAFVANGNPFNSAPESGKEYAMVYFYVKNVKDLSGKDDPLSLSSVIFDVADENYKKRSNFLLVAGVPDIIDAEVYEGITHEGFVVTQAEIGKPFYLVLNDKYWFYVDGKSSEISDL